MPIQKKKQSILSKLGIKLKTPKGRLVSTVLAFAVVGGGILVYKSFAAVAPVYAWPYGRDFYPYRWSTGDKNICPSAEVSDRDVFGNAIPVVSLICKGGSQPSYANSTMSSEGAAIVSNSSAINGIRHNYRACVDFKGSGTIKLSLYGAASITTTATFTNHQYGNLYCTATRYITSPAPITAQVAIGKSQTGSVTSTWVNVRNIQIQRMD